MKVKAYPFKRTLSLCPVCKKQIQARLIRKKSGWFLEKICETHGDFSAIVWRGLPDLTNWGNYKAPDEDSAPPCPDNCGLCHSHLQDTCCVLLEVTDRCNLNCSYCFADKNSPAAAEKSPEELYFVFKELADSGKSFVQLSGGEPTVRDDLPAIVSAAKRAGCDTVQLNSNGIRIADDADFAHKLSQAGLDILFLQFDGTNDDIYTTLRGQALFDSKLKAIQICADLNIGVVLVPTIVPGVNDSNIGDILRLAIKKSPSVRGVHFQPVSFFGRFPQIPKNSDRITLPEILCAIESQSEGLIKVSDLAPSACDHPRCGFHGDFIVMPNALTALTPKHNDSDCCCTPSKNSISEALKNRRFVSRRWKRYPSMEAEFDTSANTDSLDFDSFIARVKTHGFTVSAMAFQDRFTIDLERIRRCSLHVYSDKKYIPFCLYYF